MLQLHLSDQINKFIAQGVAYIRDLTVIHYFWFWNQNIRQIRLIGTMTAEALGCVKRPSLNMALIMQYE